MKTLIQSLRLLLVLTVITGVIYPVAVWAVGRALFAEAAEGSLVFKDGKPVGSAHVAQKTKSPAYFHPRPSAADYATVASGAGNEAWTSKVLIDKVLARREALGGNDVPADLLTTSGSGLDPEISVEAALFQVGRVEAARGLDATGRRRLEELIALNTIGGRLTPARVNVLRLNLALETESPK
ncbi:MAG: potassium-transporting ATPase subunit C [Opitutaceae bacterium]|nr:potassium-transporting ATPase subunit C [Opitutaceae bacterium]